ncbi:ABC transporter substrate-binding protein [Aestuariispira insulae]|uniref:Iron(III) transport system substrate-binding protein n=1 Tax=Aestuariispira insulae TaxID=1461337 RepID=A0A3D9HRJ6_9PROT|nr:ABC transporter substrate-binding protein [Aestuariispira insulae]RED52112.1 iron(III) transport system substrate-binding protein [Aestuariispira insulae]
MRLVLSFIAFLCFTVSSFQVAAREFRHAPLNPKIPVGEGEDAGNERPERIVVYSTADHSAVRELILDFQSLNPTIAVHYHELQSLELYNRILREIEREVPTADLAISSAMDLQMKLANDGLAQRVNVPSASSMPEWAVWRNEAFGITFEPSVILYHRPSFQNRPLPKNRTELIDFLLENRSELQGRIATYDIEKSGLGYLFLARDDRQFSATWELVRAMGLTQVALFPSSSQIINQVASGKAILGYNVLGSYAASQIDNHPDLGIILPEDYTVVFSRIALVPKGARAPEAGRLFLEYLMSEHGQRVMADTAQFNAIHPAVQGPHTAQGLQGMNRNNLRPIKVGPGLLVYLDQAKRRRILEQWQRALSPR